MEFVLFCPYCNFNESKLIDSRIFKEGNSIKRRRECIKCKKRFTTFETIDISMQVKKRNGTYENFDKNKLNKGLQAACSFTTISHDKINVIVNNILSELLESQIREIEAKDLGLIVMKYLKKFDLVAYIRFSCVYKRLKHLDQVIDVIDSLKEK